MEFRFAPTIVFLVLSIYFVHIAVAMPRTADRRDEVILIPVDQSVATAELRKGTTASASQFPGRVPCQYEEATEDSLCQEHCIPKGYGYGICTNYVCSCI